VYLKHTHPFHYISIPPSFILPAPSQILFGGFNYAEDTHFKKLKIKGIENS
jgi:hypothetical protein